MAAGQSREGGEVRPKAVGRLRRGASANADSFGKAAAWPPHSIKDWAESRRGVLPARRVGEWRCGFGCKAAAGRGSPRKASEFWRTEMVVRYLAVRTRCDGGKESGTRKSRHGLRSGGHSKLGGCKRYAPLCPLREQRIRHPEKRGQRTGQGKNGESHTDASVCATKALAAKVVSG